MKVKRNKRIRGILKYGRRIGLKMNFDLNNRYQQNYKRQKILLLLELAADENTQSFDTKIDDKVRQK